MNREPLYEIYAKIERRIIPGLRYSQYLYEDALRDSLRPNSSWLDLGCGHRVLPVWREKEEQSLVRVVQRAVGLDYDWPSLLKHRSIQMRVRGDISHLPFSDNSFDVVTANMVVEHLEEPAAQFREIRRVLKPTGMFIFHTPNANGYTTVAARMVPEFMKSGLIQMLDGRPAEDVFETHYRANTASQIRKLANENGLDVVKIRFIATTAKFAVIAPIAFLELLWIRLLLTRAFRPLRTNLIVTLRKPFAPK
jgi:ubiquinone/menaquinone biosynthesis C-methylase UbiE